MREATVLIVMTAVILSSSAVFCEAGAKRTEVWDLHLSGARPDGMMPVPDSPARLDTIWFGGDDGTGHALEGGVWDFEGDGGSGDLQGWDSIDLTQNLDTYFGRVSVADFADDPCDTMMALPESEYGRNADLRGYRDQRSFQAARRE